MFYFPLLMLFVHSAWISVWGFKIWKSYFRTMGGTKRRNFKNQLINFVSSVFFDSILGGTVASALILQCYMSLHRETGDLFINMKLVLWISPQSAGSGKSREGFFSLYSKSSMNHIGPFLNFETKWTFRLLVA